jgi:glyoxylase-like metal-dependent hydrolase (beta-lactamase superfamily II)
MRWPPCRIDQPLPLARVGDEAEFTLSGQRIRAVFVPGHSFDLVTYLMDFGGKRIAFTGDLGFMNQDILHRCWGDREKAAQVVRTIRDKVLPFQPDYVFTGHGAHKDGTAFLEGLVQRTEEALRKKP